MSKKLLYIILTAIVGFLFIFGDAAFLYAQESSSDEFTLEEITVTAQKRAENQQKVAIAMDVISGEELAATGKSNVDDILSTLSNVMVSYNTDGMRVSLRGVTENEVTMNDMHVYNPTVAINVDGAFNKSSTAGQNLFDIERVEVLAGPQSTLYASNSPGGIVNVVTAAPKTDKYSASGSIEFGNFGLFKGQAMVNVPLVTEKLAMRLAYNQDKQDPYVSGSNQTGSNTKSARLKTLWKASDAFNATITLNYSKRGNGGMMGGQVQAFDYQDGYWYTGAGQKGEKVTDPWTAVAEGGGAPPGAAPNGPNSADQITKGVTGEINWDTGVGSLSVVPQYSKTTSDDQSQMETTVGPDTLVYMAYTHMQDIQKGVEARMTSAEDFLFKWIAGVNYYKSKGERLTDYSAYYDYTKVFGNAENNKAVFADITYPFTDRVRGTAGYRRSWDKIDVYEFPATVVAGGKYGQNYTSPDYKAGLEYDLADNSMLYFTYATSYRVNPMAANQGERTIPPEKLKAYTVGAKNRFLGNKLQLNAAAYYYDYKNKEAQVSSDGKPGRDDVIFESDIVTPEGLPYDSNGDGDYIDQLMGGPGSEDPWFKQHGTFRTIGVDLSADWVATSIDKVSLGVTYLNAKWKDLEMVFYWHKLVDGNVEPYWDSDGVNYSGRKNTYSPTWTINLGYEHNFILGSFGALVPRVDLLYKSEYVLDYQPSNYPVNYQEPYYLVNGSVTLSHASGMWSFNAYIKNATNYAAKNFLASGMGFSMGITDPRTYGAVLSVKF
jgi:iron complex outermembrane receptor protein